jgi:hypothetical protein
MRPMRFVELANVRQGNPLANQTAGLLDEPVNVPRA